MNKRIFTIADCFSFIKNGANIKQDKEKRGYPITRIETTSNNVFNRDKVGYAGIEDITPYQDYVLEDGDLLMSHINSLPYLGRVVYYDRKQEEVIIHGMNLLRLKAIKTRLRPKYATFLFSSIRFKNKILTIAKKSVNQASFSINDLKKVCIELPTVEEQDNIVDKLVGIQKIIQLRNTQLMKLDELVKCRFVEMFGVIIPDNTYVKLGDVCDIERGGSPRPIANYITNEDNGINWIKIGDTTTDRYILSAAEKIRPEGARKSRFVYAGDLLLSNSMSFGHPFILKINGCIHDGWLVLHFEKSILNTIYLHSYLSMPEVYNIFSNMAVGGVVNNLNKDMVKKLPILVPPMSLQEKFETFVQRIDKLRIGVQAALEKAQTLFDSLMQEYFG